MAIVRVRRWGKTLAFTIPFGYARECGIEQRDVYEVVMTKTGLLYRKIEKRPNLKRSLQPYAKDDIPTSGEGTI